MACVALEPPTSLAVTVTVALPAASGAMVTVLPAILAVTTPAGMAATP